MTMKLETRDSEAGDSESGDDETVDGEAEDDRALVPMDTIEPRSSSQAFQVQRMVHQRKGW